MSYPKVAPTDSSCRLENKLNDRDVQRCVMVTVARDGIEPSSLLFEAQTISRWLRPARPI
jgi:hypothetical protein